MPKRSNREKLVQEQLNDEETIKKRRFLMTIKRRKKRQKKNDEKRSKNDDFNWNKKRHKKRQKTTKKLSFLTVKRRPKRRKLMKTKNTTTKRRKRRQNDEKRQLLTKYRRFFVVVLYTGKIWLNEYAASEPTKKLNKIEYFQPNLCVPTKLNVKIKNLEWNERNKKTHLVSLILIPPECTNVSSLRLGIDKENDSFSSKNKKKYLFD